MHWRVIPGAVAVLVHTSESPTDQDWDQFLADVTNNLTDIKGVLVYTQAVGPSAPQRARSSAAFSNAGAEIQTAIMTGSRMVRGIVTALTWAVGGKVKAFSTLEFIRATEYLGLEDDDQLRTRVVLKQLARAAGTVIDAFADESGQFNQKYS
jgi:hypothetical protein